MTMTTTILTDHGRYLSAQPDGRMEADRAWERSWEQFAPEVSADGRVAFRVLSHGGRTYLRAEPDGRLLHQVPGTHDGQPGLYELFWPEVVGERAVTLRTWQGTYVCAELDLSVGHRRPGTDDGSPAGWETVGVTPWWTAPGVAVEPLRGPVRASYGGGLVDLTGPRLVAVCHAGDLLSRWTRDEATVGRHLDTIAGAGYVGVRTWTILYGDYWRARTGEVYPDAPLDYWTQVRRFAEALISRGLRWLVSQGDLMRWASTAGTQRQYLAELATVLRDAGGAESLVLGVDAANEGGNNGEGSPEALWDALRAFLAVLPVPIYSLTSSDEHAQNRFVAHGAMRDIHSSRDRWPIPARYVFNVGYDPEDGQRLYTLQSEGPGPGPHVSVMAEPHVFLEPETMGVLAACHAIGKALYVYMSSPGVISDEPFDTYPAFALVPKLFARLPPDVQTWRTFHGNEGRPFSPDRVLAVPDDDRLDVRCDHAAQGRSRVVVIYGPPGTYEFRVVNDFHGSLIQPGTLEESRVDWPRGGRVVLTFRRGAVLVGEIGG